MSNFERLEYTLDAIADQIVNIFSQINYGELYYHRILNSVWYKQPIIIEKKHLEPIKEIIKPITTDQLKLVINKALYKFLDKNTAYGFADWALKENKMVWQLA